MKFTYLIPLLVFGVIASPLGKHARVVDSVTASTTTYDFIIVGAGIGGLTVADRLTEDPETSVLVIEYGSFDQGEDAVLVPGSYFPVPYFWPNIFSTPQRGLNNGTYFVPMGRVVGGGSTINAMFFLRCPAVDYDSWEDLGNRGWGWAGLLPYFQKSETFGKPEASFAKQYNISWDDSAHGFQGPVQTTYSPYDYPSSANFWNAATAEGIAPRRDPNAGDATGLFWLLRALDPVKRVRSYARTVHYERVKSSRPNYHLLPEHAVSKVLFKDKKAIGVEYISPNTGKIQTAKATKEVVMAAGAVHSPQILQLSGVGPKSLLEGFGIKVVVDLPGVGSNFQDHLDLKVDYTFTSNLFPNADSLTTNATYNTEQRSLYDTTQTGAYTLTRGTGNNIALLPLKNTTSKWASIISLAKSQNPASLLPPNTHPSIIKGYTAQRQQLIKQYLSPSSAIGSLSWNTGTQTTVYTIKPLSRGSVTINSTSILDNPLIDFGALSDPTDIELVLALFRKNRQIMSQPSMRALGPTEISPGADLVGDEELKAKFRTLINPSNAHECCTLPMMKLELGGVVDEALRVYGVRGLSVADASFMPITPASAPSATIYAAGEKAADLIKKRHGLPPFDRSHPDDDAVEQ
ncbi:related to alcohol oxidase [Rhynchosporium agropyri]|uniref:Related to alcohol oxidase n=1 Tax=Rhynchosporium agropyri TaxID=914238 RepID=A0A1E1KIA3_9HELO|nr:related to alcohol oxidase [Rhynchosporium agropyri]